MTQKIIECIPNFSEGRRPEVLEAIQSALTAVPQVHILDTHVDPDHNRTVITLAGPPEAVVEAAYAAIAVAAERIDLDQHRGEHPRLGATDVVPFVPLSGITMEECVELARSLGRRVGEEFKIPVFLYERAATRPDRVNLEDIRRGEYEALKEAIGTDPDRAPDFGPRRLGTAGATVIGARPPLIAFNMYLDTADLSVAKEIARTIRYSSGGLPFVKALGMMVQDQAQVSMNLTDFTQTPVSQVVETVRREAASRGVGVHHSELVGLIPQAALVDTAAWYLQLDQFEPSQILESRLFAALEGQAPFLEQLAAGTPTPGGGSAAAYAGGMAAALVCMVARLTLARKKFADVHERVQEILEEAEELKGSLEGAVVRDSAAFEGVMAALRLPKDTEDQKTARGRAIEAATHQAAEVPLQVAGQAARVLVLAAEVADIGNPNAITDAGSAGSMARASLQAAGLNVQINASSVSDRSAAQRWLAEIRELEERAREAEGRLRGTLKERAGLTS